jgi:hypothetical protein
MKFKQYRRKQIAELRPVTQKDINDYFVHSDIAVHETKDNMIVVSISDVDRQNGSPKLGDMIARNPKNHLDQWLVAKEYFEDNFELI